MVTLAAPGRSSSTVKLRPSAGCAPLPVNGSWRYTGDLGNLVYGKTTEKAHLGNSSPALINLIQSFQGAMDVQQLGGMLDRYCQRIL